MTDNDGGDHPGIDPAASTLLTAIAKAAARLRLLAATDEPLRAALLDLGRSILELASDPTPTRRPAPPRASESGSESASESISHADPAAASPLTPVDTTTISPIPEPAPAPAAEPAAEPPAPVSAQSPAATPSPGTPGTLAVPVGAPRIVSLPELTLGRRTPTNPPEPPAAFPARGSGAGLWAADEINPELIERRCRLKAEGARWAADRAGGAADAEPGGPRYADLISRAKAVSGCFLWMCRRPDVDPAHWHAVAAAFDALAEAVAAARLALAAAAARPDARPDADLADALALLAEATSAARVACAGIDGDDDDQELAFIWLRRLCLERRVLVHRHMKLDDPADPARAPAVAVDARALADRLRALADRDRDVAKLFGKLRYRVEKAIDPADWDAIAALASDLLARHRVAASDRRIRDVLLPALPRIPDLADPSPEWTRVVAALRAAPRDPATTDDDDADRDAGATPDSPTAEEIVYRAAAEFPDRLALALNGRSWLADNPFQDTPALDRALRFLATTYVDAKRGTRPCPDLDLACRQTCGFSYSPHQSPVTVGCYPEDYETTYAGRHLHLGSHLGTGNSRDPRRTLRIAFTFDDQSGKVVIGFIGQHQRTTAT